MQNGKSQYIFPKKADIFLLNKKIFLLMVFKRNISVGKGIKNKSHPFGFLQNNVSDF